MILQKLDKKMTLNEIIQLIVKIFDIVLMINIFVLVMMLVIEYYNVLTKETWHIWWKHSASPESYTTSKAMRLML